MNASEPGSFRRRFPAVFSGRIAGAAALAVLAALAAGCGTAAYEARMKTRLEELRKASRFVELLNPTPVISPELGLSLRLPKAFDGESRSWAPGMKDDDFPLSIERLQPIPIRLPGLRFCFERFIIVGTRQPVAIHCYVAVVPVSRPESAAAEADQLMAELLKQLPAVEAESPPEWEEFAAPTPDGGSLVWKRLSATFPMRFDSTSEGWIAADHEGRLDLYLQTAEDRQVLIGWRAPTAYAEKDVFFRAAEAAMGVVELAPLPEEGLPPAPGAPGSVPTAEQPAQPAPGTSEDQAPGTGGDTAADSTAPPVEPVRTTDEIALDALRAWNPATPAEARQKAIALKYYEIPVESRPPANLAAVGAAMLRYLDEHGTLPPRAIVSPGGEPLLSWRVTLLPMLGYAALYEQFRLDEPWDSEHNQRLIAQIPVFYLSPERRDGRTNVQVPVGPDTAFPGWEGMPRQRLGTVLPGLILAVETNEDRVVAWTQPDDHRFTASSPGVGLDGLRRGGFLAVFGSGEVRRIRPTDAPTLVGAAFRLSAGAEHGGSVGELLPLHPQAEELLTLLRETASP